MVFWNLVQNKKLNIFWLNADETDQKIGRTNKLIFKKAIYIEKVSDTLQQKDISSKVLTLNCR